jgi:hypothetical protein
MIIIIAGGRDFDDYEMLKNEVDYFIYKNGIYFTNKPVILSGGAKGADKLGERYAREKGYELVTKDADWDKYDYSAGHIRNKQMAQLADCCILFWDGLSSGTHNMMKTSNMLGLITKVIYYNKKG